MNQAGSQPRTRHISILASLLAVMTALATMLAFSMTVAVAQETPTPGADATPAPGDDDNGDDNGLGDDDNGLGDDDNGLGDDDATPGAQQTPDAPETGTGLAQGGGSGGANLPLLGLALALLAGGASTIVWARARQRS